MIWQEYHQLTLNLTIIFYVSCTAVTVCDVW